MIRAEKRCHPQYGDRPPACANLHTKMLGNHPPLTAATHRKVGNLDRTLWNMWIEARKRFLALNKGDVVRSQLLFGNPAIGAAKQGDERHRLYRRKS